MQFIGVTEGVVQHLRNEIITGELAAGQKLSEAQLASRLGISRAPLREAFRILGNDRLVVSIPRKGCYVPEISMADCHELYQAREMIECYAFDLLKAKGIRDLPLVKQAMAEAFALPIPPADDKEQRLKHLSAFSAYHVKLVESAGNNPLIEFYQSISWRMARYQFMYDYIPALKQRSREQHREILEFVKLGSYDQAKECMRRHIISFLDYLKDKMRERPFVAQTMTLRGE